MLRPDVALGSRTFFGRERAGPWRLAWRRFGWRVERGGGLAYTLPEEPFAPVAGPADVLRVVLQDLYCREVRYRHHAVGLEPLKLYDVPHREAPLPLRG